MGQQIIGKTERDKRMCARSGGLEIELSASSKRKQAEIAGTVELIHIHFESGRCGIIEITVFEAGQKQFRERERRAESHFIAVDFRTARIGVSCLPLIGTAKLDAEVLTTAEEVSFGKTEDSARSHLIIALSRSIHLQFAIERKIIGRIDVDVERILTGRGVFRHELHLRIFEDAKA